MNRHRLARTAVIVTLLTLVFAACGGGDPGDGSTVSVTGTDGLQFEPERLSAAPGEVTVELTAGDEAEHTFVIEDLGDQEVVAAAAGSTATGTVDLEAGTYTFYCDIPGHREAGMVGTLEVG